MLALVWANVDIASYRAFVYFDVGQLVRPADAAKQPLVNTPRMRSIRKRRAKDMG